MRIVTLLHEEAEKLEKQGGTQGKIGNTHAMQMNHGKQDTQVNKMNHKTNTVNKT